MLAILNSATTFVRWWMELELLNNIALYFIAVFVFRLKWACYFFTKVIQVKLYPDMGKYIC